MNSEITWYIFTEKLQDQKEHLVTSPDLPWQISCSSPSHSPCALFPCMLGWKVLHKCVQHQVTSRGREANTSSGKSAPLLEIWALFLLDFLWFQLTVIDSCSGSLWWIKQAFLAASTFSHFRHSYSTNISPLAPLSAKCSTQSFKSFVAWNISPFADYFLWPFTYPIL